MNQNTEADSSFFIFGFDPRELQFLYSLFDNNNDVKLSKSFTNAKQWLMNLFLNDGNDKLVDQVSSFRDEVVVWLDKMADLAYQRSNQCINDALTCRDTGNYSSYADYLEQATKHANKYKILHEFSNWLKSI